MSRRRSFAAALTATLVGVVVLCPVAPVGAQGAGSSASTVLRIPPGPRPLALGNALVAVRDSWSLEYNPAGAIADSVTVAAAYQALPVGASAGAAAVAIPVNLAVTVGLSTRFVDYGEIDVLEPGPGAPVGVPSGATASGGEVTMLVGGVARWGRVAIGLGGRWFRMDVAGLTDDAFAIDAGVSVVPVRGVRIGGSVQNVGGEVAAGRAAPLPRTVRAGGAVEGHVGPAAALVTFEARRREGRTGVGAGVELRGGGAVEGVARLGYESRAAPGDGYSRFVFGGGLRIDRVGVDLAYRALGPLGSTRQVGLSYRF